MLDVVGCACTTIVFSDLMLYVSVGVGATFSRSCRLPFNSFSKFGCVLFCITDGCHVFSFLQLLVLTVSAIVLVHLTRICVIFLKNEWDSRTVFYS